MCVTGCVFVCMEMMTTDRWWMNKREGEKGRHERRETKGGRGKGRNKGGKKKGNKSFHFKINSKLVGQI